MAEPHANVPLAPLTTMGVGGAADFYAEARTPEDLTRLLAWARDRNLPCFLLGGGSNLLFADSGLRGLVIRNALAAREVLEDTPHHVTVRAGAGEPWDDFVAWSTGAGLAGLECLSGIPGTVGATPIQNVGAYGQEVAQTITDVSVLDTESGAQRCLSAAGCEFAYRDSIFKRPAGQAWWVTSVTFRLARGGPPQTGYRDIAEDLARSGIDSPALADVRESVLRVRRSKGMVHDPTDPESRSCGSFFKNPVLTAAEFDAVCERLHANGVIPSGAEPPSFPAGGGHCKLPAAWIIECAGFTKGTARGPARISSKHTLALVNGGGASQADLLALAQEIRTRVHDRFGVRLEPEPLILDDHGRVVPL